MSIISFFQVFDDFCEHIDQSTLVEIFESGHKQSNEYSEIRIGIDLVFYGETLEEGFVYHLLSVEFL